MLSSQSSGIEAPLPRAAAIRRALALALWWFAAAVALLVAGVSLTGGGRYEVGALTVSITSWKVIRVAVIACALGVAVHPARRAAWLRAEEWVDRWRRPVLVTAFLLFFAYLGIFKSAQHLSLRTGAYDLSMFHHAVHNTLRGKFLHAYGIDRNFFSEHFSPLLLVFVPLYALWSSPLLMLWAQALGVALAAVPLHLLFRHHHLSRLVSLIGVAAFALNGALWRAFGFDFHIELFLPLAVFTAVLFGVRKQWGLFHLTTLLALTIKEDMVLVMPCAAALVWLYDRRAWKHAGATLALSAVWGVLAWKLVIPSSYPDGVRHASHFVERYAHLGQSYSEIAWSLISRPEWTLGRVFTPATAALVGSVGFVPLLDPATLLLAIPPVLLHLVSGYGFQAALGVYYGIGALAFLFLGLPRVLGRAQRLRGGFASAALGALALAFEPQAPFVTPPTERDAAARAFLGGLPAHGVFSAQSTAIPQLAPEAKIILFPEGVGAAEYVLVDVERTTWPIERVDHRERVLALLASGQFGVVQRSGGFIALKRGADPARNEDTAEWLRRFTLPRD